MRKLLPYLLALGCFSLALFGSVDVEFGDARFAVGNTTMRNWHFVPMVGKSPCAVPLVGGGYPCAAVPPVVVPAVVWSATDIGSGITGGGTATVASTTGSDTAGRATISFSFPSKVYYEFTTSSATADFVGWANSSQSLSAILGVGGSANSLGLRGSNGFRVSGTDESVGTFPGGDRIGIAFDMGNFVAWWKDITASGPWEPSGDPNLGTGGFTSANNASFTPTSFVGPYFPAYSFSASSQTTTAFFASASLLGAIPTGFVSVHP